MTSDLILSDTERLFLGLVSAKWLQLEHRFVLNTNIKSYVIYNIEFNLEEP